MRVFTQRGPTSWALRLALTLLVATFVSWRAAAQDKCSEAFAGNLAARLADITHPSFGVVYAGDAYYLQTSGAAVKAATRPDLETLLLAKMAAQGADHDSLEIYFQGLQHRDAL